jgi:hypothetical protein
VKPRAKILAIETEWLNSIKADLVVCEIFSLVDWKQKEKEEHEK